jgi:hypothetical protein
VADDFDLMRLPAHPTAEQLRRTLALGYSGAFAVTGPSPELPFLNSFLTGAEILGRAVDPGSIRRRFAALNWETTFKTISVIAATLSRQGILGEAQKDLMTALTRQQDPHPLSAVMAARLPEHIGKRPILHERLLYVMFQLAAEECQIDSGRTPSFVEMTYLGLLLNDHIDHGYTDAIEQQTNFASAIALALRYNQDRDRLRAITRSYSMLVEAPPTHAQLAKNPQLWLEIQHEACSGHLLDDYFALFMYPMILFSQSVWGQKDVPPQLDVSLWYKNAPQLQPVAHSWIAPLTTTKDELVSAREQSAIPIAPRTLLRKPFVRFGDQYWASSPWACQRQLHTGIRHRLFQAAKRLGRKHEEAWTFSLGDMFEQWAHQMTRSASEGRHMRGTFLVPDEPGRDEVEDIVWTHEKVAILFSVKSTLMAEDDAFNVKSESGVVDWFEKFLFAQRRPKYRPGAARLLDLKVERIRAGGTTIARDATIYPVVVMYDDPLESVGVIDWLAQRQHELGVLTQPGVRPLLVCSIDTYEALLFLAHSGRDLGVLFEQKQSEAWRRVRFDVFLNHFSTEEHFRLPEIEKRYVEASRRVLEKLKREARIPEA